MASNSCLVCGLPLNESQYSVNDDYKSCPKCSTENGKEHVYYTYPENFGITDKRSSAKNPEGPQSYCVPCRGRGTSGSPKVLCSKIVKR